MEEKNQYTLEEAHLHFAKTFNGEVWSLLDKENRSREDGERMLAAAFASYCHWLYAGKGVQRQRGEYMIARVYLSLGNISEALSHARRCLELTTEFREEMADFDFAFAYEMYARVNAASGDLTTARQYRQKAQEAGSQIDNAEDKEIFMADFKGGNWYGQ